MGEVQSCCTAKRRNMRKEKGRGSDPLHNNRQTDTDTKQSVARDFELFPRAVSIAVKSGEITGKQFHVLAFIIGDINWQTREWRGTLIAMHELSDFPDSPDYLRKQLHVLRETEWVCFDMKQGQRHYVITLGPRYYEALYGSRPDRDQTQTPPSSLNFPQTAQGSSVPGIAGTNGHTSDSQHRVDPSPYTETDTDTDTERETETREAHSGEGGEVGDTPWERAAVRFTP
jgi:hypothetical protein